MLLAIGVKAEDTGIIRIYSKDVCQIIRQLIAAGVRNVETEAVPNPQVSTVDAFQGREKKIMLFHQFLFGDLHYGMLWQANRVKKRSATEEVEKVITWVVEHGQAMDWSKVTRDIKDNDKYVHEQTVQVDLDALVDMRAYSTEVGKWFTVEEFMNFSHQWQRELIDKGTAHISGTTLGFMPAEKEGS
ncbi:hypothetical protein LTR17_001010 [Elasticomyces elasticus]|nr:hypothetical protein LTR17_001010 [Elasticomyces elasticus]